MKKSFLLLFLISQFLVIMLTSCANHSNEIAEFESEQQSSDNIAKGIANYLASFDEIEDCNVQINGNTAVIGLDLAHKHSDAKLIALKKRIATDIKSQYDAIARVAINTAPDMLKNIQGENDDAQSTEIEKALEKNSDEEIFVNVVPTI